MSATKEPMFRMVRSTETRLTAAITAFVEELFRKYPPSPVQKQTLYAWGYESYYEADERHRFMRVIHQRLYNSANTIVYRTGVPEEEFRAGLLLLLM